ncbi:hypothetical protein SAMN05444162_0123 [Paenibacillaceae bacterium GAS479]|nr:hypothetical protein SAMN05444162_0123 [Paenibacillaceae bacterium GAS479]
MLSKQAARRINGLIESMCSRVEANAGIITADQVEPIARLVDALGLEEGRLTDVIGFIAPAEGPDEE